MPKMYLKVIIKNSNKIFKKGNFVRLNESDYFGVIEEVIEKYGHWGARVMWTSYGEISWTPLVCIELLCEETESSVDETSRDYV